MTTFNVYNISSPIGNIENWLFLVFLKVRTCAERKLSLKILVNTVEF